MKKQINPRIIFMLAASLIASAVSAQTLTLKWKTDTLFRVPESVFVDSKNKVLYVANIDGKSDAKDGQGFISKVAPDGKVITLQWVSGLNAPKGMGVVKNTLYVADLDRIAIIDIPSGKVSFHEIPDAQFLNDVTTDDKGNVYVSDSRSGKIYKYANNKSEVYYENPEIKGTNGLLIEKGHLYFVDFPTGKFYKLDGSKKLTQIGTSGQGGDGIVPVGKDAFLISSWYGEIYLLDAAGKATKLLDTKDQKLNTADIYYDAASKTLYVPTFFGNSVAAYTFAM
ncbi:SMP-30/gluconolactonase/LRE family protein [Ohtaekwangia sp.]|uniref:SMP-30/gluconolactonase/LRE family protein n=1 Tax=Ohtaekwangia sp. TaxID=2066019 RepID=UPI002FDD8106